MKEQLQKDFDSSIKNLSLSNINFLLNIQIITLVTKHKK